MEGETVVKEVVHEHNDGGSGTGVIAGILIAVLIILLAYLAYEKGLIGNKGEAENDTNSAIEINVGGNTDDKPADSSY